MGFNWLLNSIKIGNFPIFPYNISNGPNPFIILLSNSKSPKIPEIANKSKATYDNCVEKETLIYSNLEYIFNFFAYTAKLCIFDKFEYRFAVM